MPSEGSSKSSKLKPKKNVKHDTERKEQQKSQQHKSEAKNLKTIERVKGTTHEPKDPTEDITMSQDEVSKERGQGNATPEEAPKKKNEIEEGLATSQKQIECVDDKKLNFQETSRKETLDNIEEETVSKNNLETSDRPSKVATPSVASPIKRSDDDDAQGITALSTTLPGLQVDSSNSVVTHDHTEQSVYVHQIRFNQDGSCFVASTTEGFRVFTCSPLSEFGRREEAEMTNIIIVAMLYRSYSFAYVTENEPRKVQLWNDREGRVVGVIRCRHTIRNVLLNREIIAVVTDTAIYIYLAGTVSPLHVLTTGTNAGGLCTLSDDSNYPWRLACPTITPGVIRIQSAQNQESVIFQAHKNPLSCFQLNSTGLLIATASIIGTLIRIFSTIDGVCLQEFRIGSIPHSIKCIVIRRDNQFIVVTSTSLTLHIFKLKNDLLMHRKIRSKSILTETRNDSSCGRIDNNNNNSEDLTTSSLSSLTSAMVSHGKGLLEGSLKSVLPKYFLPERSFSHITIPVDMELDVRSCSNGALLQHRCCSFQNKNQESELRRESIVGITNNRPPINFSNSIPSENFCQSSVSNALRFRSKTVVRSNGNCCHCGYGSFCSTGPICSFAGDKSNHLYVIHHDGFFYEIRFDSQQGGVCHILSTSPWFAPRRDFNLKNTNLTGIYRNDFQKDEYQHRIDKLLSITSSKYPIMDDQMDASYTDADLNATNQPAENRMTTIENHLICDSNNSDSDLPTQWEFC